MTIASGSAALATDLLNALDAGGQISPTAATELTIASGSITVTQTYHTVDTQSDASTDDLDTIVGGAEMDWLVIRPDNDARSIVIKHDADNISCMGQVDITLDDVEDCSLLFYDAGLTKWLAAKLTGGGGGLEGGDYWGGNLLHNYPSGSGDGVQPAQWVESTGNVTLTDEDATGAGIPQKYERVFKVVNSGGSGSANRITQVLTIANENLLDSAVSIISAGCWVYTATAGTTTLELYNDGGTASLGTATTTTTSSWVWLEVKEKTIGTTSVSFRLYHSADPATFYMALPMCNIGAVVRPWDRRERGKIEQVVVGTTTTQTTSTSNSYVDTALTATIVTKGGNILALMNSTARNASGNAIAVGLKLDATSEAGVTGMSGGAGDRTAVTIAHLFTGLAAGSHTVLARFLGEVDGQTIYFNAISSVFTAPATMTLMEVAI
jgi:hypothetical protein